MSSQPAQTAFRLSQEMIDQLDELVVRINEVRPWPKTTRSDLVRSILHHVLSEKPVPAWLLKP